MLEQDAEAAQMMLGEDDKEMRKMGQEELTGLKVQQKTLLAKLQKLLLPKDPNDDKNIFLEIARALAETKQLFFQEICFACTQAMLSHSAGK